MFRAMPFSACALKKNIFIDVDFVVKKQIEIWFTVVGALIDNETRHHSSQNLFLTHSAAPCASTMNILITVMTRIVVDKTTDNAKPYFIY